MAIVQISGKLFHVIYLMKNSDKVEKGSWIDLLGCGEAVITVEGLQEGDTIRVYGANTVDYPPDGYEVELGKGRKTDGEYRVNDSYRWYRADHVEASGKSVRVHLIGRIG
jgi:hypothetical protein